MEVLSSVLNRPSVYQKLSICSEEIVANKFFDLVEGFADGVDNVTKSHNVCEFILNVKKGYVSDAYWNYFVLHVN